MKTPRVEFRTSTIYDAHWKRLTKKSDPKQRYPSRKTQVQFLKKLEKAWRPIEKKVLTEISKSTKMTWKPEVIVCYVVGRCRAFSEPLTLPVYFAPIDFAVDVLTHELIHNIYRQNMRKSMKAWNYVWKKYRRESDITRIHVPLHAAHHQIYLRLFNHKRLERDIKRSSKMKNYRKSWEIVQKEGPENIIKEFKKRI